MVNVTITGLSTTFNSAVTSLNDNTKALIDDPYYVSPGFSSLVFDACTGILIITGIIGIIANFGIIILFAICSHVSFRVPTLASERS